MRPPSNDRDLDFSGISVSDFLGGNNSGANDNDRDLSYLESVPGKELARGSGSSVDPADSSPAPRGRYERYAEGGEKMGEGERRVGGGYNLENNILSGGMH